MLAERFGTLDLEEVLLPREAFRPFARACDRPFWEGLPKRLRLRLVAAGETYAGRPWPSLPAALYMENKRNGNRSRYEAAYFARRSALCALTLAECAERKGRFLYGIVDSLWSVCEESSWCIPAHTEEPLPDVRRPVVDLFAAETASMLAWVWYLLKSELDGVSPAVCARIEYEVGLRVMDPYLARDDFWWMGILPHPNGPVNNWNPWCNSNCLTAFLLLEADPVRREAAVRKSLTSLDKFLATYQPDGGCDEGTSYWGVAGGALFDCLELLHGATRGAIDAYDEPLVGNIGRFICRSHIAGEYYVNFADGGAKVKIPAELVWRSGARIGDPALQAQGAYAFLLAGESCPATVHGSLYRPLWEIASHETLRQTKAEPPLLRDAWMPGIGVMAARENPGSARGLYLAAKGGHNGESHNHNDVGSYVVYSDGLPVLIDVGVETYTAKTFSPQRYDIWTMQSQYHNLPAVNGIQQREGSQYRAKDVRYTCGEDEAALDMDIEGAYPAEAGIASWKRSLRLQRGGRACIHIADRFELMESSNELTYSVMTCCEHEISPSGSIAFAVPGGRGVHMSFHGDSYRAASERIEISDERLSPVWGDHIYRILLKSKKPVKEGVMELRVEQA